MAYCNVSQNFSLPRILTFLEPSALIQLGFKMLRDKEREGITLKITLLFIIMGIDT